jgi:precorrin-6Y C5,15-methyltransferase (decarboxylating)
MITKAEVRAVAIARLAPRPGCLVWDVGAGSGSVAVECARLGAAALAVERRIDDAERVTANADAHGVEVRVVPGAAPAALAGLPRPDAVFVGGGGPDVVTAAAAAGPERIVVALAALDRIVPSRSALLAAGYRVDGVQLAASRLAELPDGAVRLAATNPIVLLWGDRKR